MILEPAQRFLAFSRVMEALPSWAVMPAKTCHLENKVISKLSNASPGFANRCV